MLKIFKFHVEMVIKKSYQQKTDIVCESFIKAASTNAVFHSYQNIQ